MSSRTFDFINANDQLPALTKRFVHAFKFSQALGDFGPRSADEIGDDPVAERRFLQRAAWFFFRLNLKIVRTARR